MGNSSIHLIPMATAYYQSPLGLLIIQGSEKGISSIHWSNEGNRKNQTPELLHDCVSQLEAYFKRERFTFTLQLDWSGATDFDQQVWKYLLTIPYGKTVSYSDVAQAIGSPKGVRAVGAANGRNPIPIIVPCHRVIGKNGDLVGFSGGLDVKSKLLEIERPLEFGRQGQLF